jgi:hypothetical protein
MRQTISLMNTGGGQQIREDADKASTEQINVAPRALFVLYSRH